MIRIFKVYLLLLLSFLLNGCMVLKPSASKQFLKILTYNIHHANPPLYPNRIDLPAIAAVIKASGADLVALQEIDVHTIRSGSEVNQIKELGRLTGMHYFFVKGIDYEGGEYGVGILSKFPLLKTDSLRLPMKEGVGGEPRVVALATVEPTKGKKLIFASTHFDLKPETRQVQALYITEYFSTIEEPVIIGGDFNAVPDSDVILHLDQHFTRSSIKNGFTIPVIEPQREIDYIMYCPSKKFQVINHKVIKEIYASDHLPVLVEFLYK